MSTLATASDIQTSAIGELMRLVLSNATRRPDVVIAWYARFMQLTVKTTVEYCKRVLQPQDLSIKANGVYQHILRHCPADQDLLAVLKMIDAGPYAQDLKISGRTVDTLMTRFPKYHNVCYYLDVTDPDHSTILGGESTPGRTVILFDIGSSYRNKMHQYSKTYFDCFARGDVVEHTLSCSRKINISMCQFMFYLWARRFQVFEFLKAEFERVIVVRQHGQKTTYKPKKRLRRKNASTNVVSDIKKTVLCPVGMACEPARKRSCDSVRMGQPSRPPPRFAPLPRCQSLVDYMSTRQLKKKQTTTRKDVSGTLSWLAELAASNAYEHRAASPSPEAAVGGN